MKKATCKLSKNRGTWVVEWEGGHAVFGDLKRARAFKDGFNTAITLEKSRIVKKCLEIINHSIDKDDAYKEILDEFPDD